MDSQMAYRPTPRELEVLRLICEGYSTKEVAAKLGITFRTAACHRCHLLDKAGARNVVLLFRWAVDNGYVTVDTPGSGPNDATVQRVLEADDYGNQKPTATEP